MKLLILLTTLALLETSRAKPAPDATDATDATDVSDATDGQQLPPLDLEAIKEGVVFELYTRENEETPENIDVSAMEQNIAKPEYFNPQNPVRICVHGWNPDDVTMEPVRTAFLKKGDYNVITMNWIKVGTGPYKSARRKATILGTWLAKLLDVLVDTYGLNVSDFHIIGFSLGAHISGEAGRYTKKGKVGRITGLDPAGPHFNGKSPDLLTHEAAAFVDIIHTCADVFGFYQPKGHADFYPNRGISTQPGCARVPWSSCSHVRAISLFAESINSMEFESKPYEGGPEGQFPANKEMAVMGYQIDESTRGVYYLETSNSSPFALSSAGALTSPTPKGKSVFLSSVLASIKGFISDSKNQ